MEARVHRTVFFVLFLAACSDGRQDGRAGEAALLEATTATVLVHYPAERGPAGLGHRITLRCGGDGHDWNIPLSTTWTEGDVWRRSIDVGSSTACKPLFDDQHWALGANWTIAAGQTVHVWPWFFHDTGKIEQIPNWHSQNLGNDRRIWIYYPPSYDENPNERYPVVYMHDGQNLFYDEEAFGGVSWNVGGAMDQGTRNGTIHEAIVVGIDNTQDRIAEYTPVPDPEYGGGNAARYLGFVEGELKSQLDAQLRTLPDAAHTALIGSSLGGLFSLYAGMERPGVFGNVGALSPSTWWAGEWLIGRSQTAQPPLPGRVYIDSGNAGNSNDDAPRTARLAAIWKAKPGITTRYLVQDGASHSEVYWRQRIPGALAFLLGPR